MLDLKMGGWEEELHRYFGRLELHCSIWNRRNLCRFGYELLFRSRHDWNGCVLELCNKRGMGGRIGRLAQICTWLLKNRVDPGHWSECIRRVVSCVLIRPRVPSGTPGRD